MPPRKKLGTFRFDRPNKGNPGPTAAQVLANVTAATNAPTPIKPVKLGKPKAYSDAICKHVVKLGASGASIAGIATALGVHRQRISEWEREYPLFADAMARAREASQEWWERHGQQHLTADRYQGQVWQRTMAARFPEYREVQQKQGVLDGAADLLAAIDEVAKRMGQRSALPGDDAKLVDATLDRCTSGAGDS